MRRKKKKKKKKKAIFLDLKKGRVHRTLVTVLSVKIYMFSS
jgi:hypothetical protein